jgi:hypothetical protein
MSGTVADFPIALSRFAGRLPLGHPDQIWLGPLRVFHGEEKHTVGEWQKLIEELKDRPVPRD